MSRLKLGCLSVLGAAVVGGGWVLWQMHLPQAIVTSVWPFETYYSVHAEVELDGKSHTLEGVGRCDWQWHFSILNLNGYQGRMTHHGGFLTKMLDDGRAMVIFPGRYCEEDSAGTVNRKGIFFKEIDLMTGDVRSPEGNRNDPFYFLKEPPPVVVLDDARNPKSIRYYPAPKQYAAFDCARLRFRSYRVTIASSGEITRRELDVPYLAKLREAEQWVGYVGRVIPFSALSKFAWAQNLLDHPPPLFTSFNDVAAAPKNWRRELKINSPREIAWDRGTSSVTLPPTFVGNCPDVATLYRRGPGELTIKSGSAGIAQGMLPANEFAVDGADKILFSIQRYDRDFQPAASGATD